MAREDTARYRTLLEHCVDLSKPFDNKRQSFYFLLDKSGALAKPLDYYFVSQFHDGLAAVTEPKEGEYRTGFINSSGELAIPLKFTNAGIFSEGLAWVWSGSGENGYIDRTGQQVIKSRDYAEGRPFSEGLSAVQIKANDDANTAHGKWGFIDRNGNIVIKPQYEGAGDFVQGRAAVEVIGKWRYIDKSGATIGDEYDGAKPFSEGFAAVCNEGKWGFVSTDGKVAIPLVYEAAGHFSEGRAAIKSGGKFGFIDKKGNVVIAPHFIEVGWFSNRLCPATLGGRWGFVDDSGKFKIAPRFDHCDSFCDGRARVRIGFSFGFVDEHGDFIVKPQYEFAYPYSDQMAIARKRNWDHPIAREELMNLHLAGWKARLDQHGKSAASSSNHNNHIYIPANLDEALNELTETLPTKAQQDIKTVTEHEMVCYHDGLGAWLRDNWGLTNDSRLAKYFNGIGIIHPDDMSAIILHSLWRKLHGQPIELDKQVVTYQDYWLKLRPIVDLSAQLPSDILNAELKETSGEQLSLKGLLEQQDVTVLALCGRGDSNSKRLISELDHMSAKLSQRKAACIAAIDGELEPEANGARAHVPCRHFYVPKQFFAQVSSALQLEPMVMPQTLLIRRGGMVLKRFNGLDSDTPASIETAVRAISAASAND